MIKNIFLKDENKNKYMNGDFKYSEKIYSYKNKDSINETRIDKIIIFIENERKNNHKSFVFNEILINGFNIKINKENLFEDNILSIDDFYNYDCEILEKTHKNSVNITRITLNTELIKLNYNESIEIKLNDDYSGLLNFKINIKIIN